MGAMGRKTLLAAWWVFKSAGNIIASYATGDADGGIGNDVVGGLVGRQGVGNIIASYATGNADGGGGNEDQVGSLAGIRAFAINTASYGFGSVMGAKIAGYWYCRYRHAPRG